MKAPFKTPVEVWEDDGIRILAYDGKAIEGDKTYLDFITVAINSHEALVEALDNALEVVRASSHYSTWAKAKAALALAKGEPK